MKRLILVLLFLSWLIASPALAVPISVDQSTGQQSFAGAAGDQSFSFGSLPAAGSFVACYGWIAFFFDDNYTLYDNQGNSYTVRKSSGSADTNSPRTFVAYAHNVTSSGTFTVTFDPVDDADTFYGEMECSSFLGIVTSSAEDQLASAFQDAPQSNDATVTTGATTLAIELVISVLGTYNDSPASADVHITGPSGGWTNLAINQTESGAIPGSADYKITSATGAQTATYSHDDVDTAYGWNQIVVTFKGTDQGGPRVRHVIIQ